MKRIGWIFAVVAMAIAVPASAAGNTAKARLAEARALAAKWQPDAVLVTVSALQAKDDGTAAPGLGGWIYQFYSAKAGKWIGVHAGAKGLERQDLPVGLKVPVPQDFVDSDKALDAARKAASRCGDTPRVALSPTRASRRRLLARDGRPT
jgi:hypothetical protein